MGMGDEILATGEVRRLQALDPRPVLIVDRHGRPRWSDLWRGNARIVRAPGNDCQRIVNGPGARPYIDYARSRPDRWAYTDWRCTPGELPWCRPDRRGAGRIIIEPNLKANASPNKQWGWARWKALVALAPALPWAQMGPPGTAWLRGVERIETMSFVSACEVLAAARAAVLPEGGLHHAAAALGVPAAVLFGAMTSPRNTGYDAHRNLWIDDPDALGWRVPHPACAAAWAKITPELVLQTLMEMING